MSLTLVPPVTPEAGAALYAAVPCLVSTVQAVARTRLLTVGVDAPLVAVAALLASDQIGVVVCDATGVALGTINETVLVRRLGLGQADIFATHASDVMTQDFATCAAGDLLADVIALMHARGLVQVVVIDADRRPLGVLTARDGLRALLAAGNREETLLRNYVMGVGYQ